MAVTDRLEPLVRPIVEDLGAELFDLEHEGGVVRVTVEREGGVDMEAIAELTRRISRMLDEHDPLPGRYTLEVSSPGLERTLRTPAHHRWAVGKQVTVKTRPGVDGDRRATGTIVAADDEGVTLELDEPGPGGETARTLAYGDIERTRTVFAWGPQPKPGGKAPKGAKPKGPKGGAGTGAPARGRAARDRAARAARAARAEGDPPSGEAPADRDPNKEAKVDT